MRLEAKPLQLLHELLSARGEVVSKDDLLDRIWPGVTVVEASLGTAVHKLRVALRDRDRADQIVMTVPRVGYRIAVEVTVGEPPVAAGLRADADIPAAPRRRSWAAAMATVSIGVAVAIVYLNAGPAEADQVAPVLDEPHMRSALRGLDVRTVERMIDIGWDVDEPVDAEGNTALNVLLEQCEWNASHDRARMVLVARALIDGGASIVHRNRWGDTPYSIAKADRFCGPDHPVTAMLRNLCFNGGSPPGDACVASYELARRGDGKSAVRPGSSASGEVID